MVTGRYRAAEVAPKGVERFEWPRLLPRVAAGVEELEWVVWTRVCDTYCHASIERITRRRWNLTAELGRTFQVRILAVFGVDTSTRRSHIARTGREPRVVWTRLPLRGLLSRSFMSGPPKSELESARIGTAA